MPFGATWRFPTTRWCSAFANCAGSSAMTDRTVIRTGSRRGYLLNASKELPEVAVAASPAEAAATRALPRPWYVGVTARWAAAILSLPG